MSKACCGDHAHKGRKSRYKALQDYCDATGEKLSEARGLAFQIIEGADKPIVAYDILAEMAKTMRNPKPPTVYRAIEFLQLHGFVHRIESLNAYIVCSTDHRHAGSQFMICDDCGQVEEAHLCHMPKGLQELTRESGFTAKRWDIELHGLCKSCAAV